LSEITIIGGGVNGLCSAYYLNQSGYEVEVLDPSFSGDGTSYGNAGMIVPSHFVPMASPGIISKGIRWIFDPSSPFYIKPRMSLSLLQWLWRFNKSCTKANVDKGQDLIWQYNELSKVEYQSISDDEGLDFGLKMQGLMMLYKNEKSQKEEVDLAEKARRLGLDAQVLGSEEVQNLNPDTTLDVLGGVYYPGDAHLYSNQFMLKLQNLLRKKGVKLTKAGLESATVVGGQVTEVLTSEGRAIQPKQLIVTAGVWSKNIMQKLGIRLLLEDGKGYSITQESIDRKPTIPSILSEEKVAITPMSKDLRITGTLEISGKSKNINHRRVRGFLDAVPKYFPEIQVPTDTEHEKIWVGYRPISFDGLPYLGRSEKVKNLTLATGHGMMGMSLGPATGKLVTQIINEEKTDLDLKLMRPSR